jgi:MFS family permease
MNDRSSTWFNRTVLGAGVTSLLADLSYETVLSVLPGYLSKLGSGPAVLGAIEGSADALASFVKLGSGWWSDAVARRKPFAVAGYFLTGLMPALIAVAAAWPLIAVARLLGWFGKGLRGPARDSLLAASVSAKDRGKAFGLHRAGDTIGAVIGPLLGAELLQHLGSGLDFPERPVLWWAVVPGVLSALAFLVLVREVRGAAVKKYTFGDAVKQLPPRYRKFLFGVGLFGAGDFSALLLVAAATRAFGGTVDAAVMGARLYALRNLAAALTAFPAGALSDRVGRLPLLAAGYAFAAAVMIGFMTAVMTATAALSVWAVLFAAAGVYIAIEEALEGAAAADLVDHPAIRGTAFGVLGAVNGVGDFISSVLVGGLALIAPFAGFAYAATVMTTGALLIARLAMSSPPRAYDSNVNA